jgi:hypothetical protein
VLRAYKLSNLKISIISTERLARFCDRAKGLRCQTSSGDPVCKNSRRYNRTRNFGLYGTENKTQKFYLPLGITIKSDFISTKTLSGPRHSDDDDANVKYVRR